MLGMNVRFYTAANLSNKSENQTMVVAMIDRLTYRSFILNITSEHLYRAEQTVESIKPFAKQVGGKQIKCQAYRFW